MGSVVLIALILVDAFEAMVLPRRIAHGFRFARLFYVHSWRPWSAIACRVTPLKRRNNYLSIFGPLSILVLMGFWSVGLIVGFGLLQWSLGSVLNLPGGRNGATASLADYLYMSGVTLFTLGYGDVTPARPLGRFIAVAETGLGYALLAVVISYLPVIYQTFSRREVTIALMDARAGSPPTAAQLLIRLAGGRDPSRLDRFMEEWERWAAEVLESHISFPVLSYYRSQHDNQSWLAALTAILDTSALVISGVGGINPHQARLTFATARHTVVDLAQVYLVAPAEADANRLPADRLRRLRDDFRAAGIDIREGEDVDNRLIELRGMYEPFLQALAHHFLLPLPPVIAETNPVDNWQTSAWMRRTRGLGALALPEPGDDHRD